MHSGGYFFTEIPNWRQWGRYIVIDRPEPTATYKVYGVGFLRGLSDLDPELFMLVYWGIRLKYIDKRIAERNNFKYFLNADKVSDVTLPQLEAHRNQALNEFNSRLATVSESIGLPVG